MESSRHGQHRRPRYLMCVCACACVHSMVIWCVSVNVLSLSLSLSLSLPHCVCSVFVIRFVSVNCYQSSAVHSWQCVQANTILRSSVLTICLPSSCSGKHYTSRDERQLRHLSDRKLSTLQVIPFLCSLFLPSSLWSLISSLFSLLFFSSHVFSLSSSILLYARQVLSFTFFERICSPLFLSLFPQFPLFSLPLSCLSSLNLCLYLPSPSPLENWSLQLLYCARVFGDFRDKRHLSSLSLSVYHFLSSSFFSPLFPPLSSSLSFSLSLSRYGLWSDRFWNLLIYFFSRISLPETVPGSPGSRLKQILDIGKKQIYFLINSLNQLLLLLLYLCYNNNSNNNNNNNFNCCCCCCCCCLF